MCVCVSECVRARVCACVCVCVRAYVAVCELPVGLISPNPGLKAHHKVGPFEPAASGLKDKHLISRAGQASYQSGWLGTAATRFIPILSCHHLSRSKCLKYFLHINGWCYDRGFGIDWRGGFPHGGSYVQACTCNSCFLLCT